MDSKLLRVICSAFLALAFVAAGCGDDEGCPSGQVMCGNKCADWLTDDDHCGQCDNACGLHADCVNGQCSCVAGYSDCSGQCVNLNFDAANCGTCGNACAAGEACVNGICTGGGCRTPMIECGTECVDPNNSEVHCGTCNNACRNDQVCTNGACACFGGETECTGACVDTQTDTANCGICGTACSANWFCIAGNCTDVGCNAPNLQCGADCIDPNTSNAHCGACDNDCDTGAGFVCNAGTCACFAGTECVAGVCADTQNDETNCGTCGTVCRADQYCNAGVCSCASGLTDCTTACVNTATDEANCGACGTACRADQICTGACACPAGSEECVAGTCADKQTDPNNCGTCGTVCGGATPFCIAGVCGGSCVSPNVQCVDGCIDPDNSNTHCGASDPCATNPGDVCSVADGFVCQSGSCQCTGGQTDCSGVCVNTQADGSNCGTCGTVCSGGQYCNSGTCACAGGLDFCGGNCVDTQSDESNCGSCGRTCNPSESCVGGQCIGQVLDYIAVVCPENAVPENMSMQCTATAYYVGGNTLDVTHDPLTEWIEEFPAGGVIDSVDEGLVMMGCCQVGDREWIKARWMGVESNQWTVQMISAYLCGVKIVPWGSDWATYGQDTDFTLPYLATNGPGDNLTWQLDAVGIYRNNSQCNTGGPYYRKITEGTADWTITPSSYLEFDWEGWEAGIREIGLAVYPTATSTTTVIYNNTGTTPQVSDELLVHIVPLTNTNWSLSASPAALSIPAGKIDAFSVFMDYDGNRLDITHMFTGNMDWDDWDLDEYNTAVPMDELVDENNPGYEWDTDDPMFMMWRVTARNTEGATFVRISVDDGQTITNTETLDIPVDVNVAVPIGCEILMETLGSPGDPDIYPEGHQAVQYRVKACMSTDPGCGAYDTELTGEDWGNGWTVEYTGAGGGLGFVDAYGTATPGLYHIPADAPQNPNPTNGTLRYHYGPAADDFCEVAIEVEDRYLCRVDLTTSVKVDGALTTEGRMLWNFNNGTSDALLPNINGETQQFWLYGTFGTLDGSDCGSNNQYEVLLPYSDIASWEYTNDDSNGNGSGDNPIFGANGVSTTTGIGTVVANATESNRVEEVKVYVTGYDFVVDSGSTWECTTVDGCSDTVIVNACGTIPATPDRQIVQYFDEASGATATSPIETFDGDTRTRAYAIAEYTSTAACYAAGSTDYWMDESLRANVRFSSQSTGVCSIDNDGLITANGTGQTLLSANWNGGAVEDNINVTIKAALVEEIALTPLGTMTNPLDVTFAPGSSDFGSIPLQRQYFATVTLTNGDVMDYYTWAATFPAAYNIYGVPFSPDIDWYWDGACPFLNIPDPQQGIVEPFGDNGPGPGENVGACPLSVVCLNCGPGAGPADGGAVPTIVFPGINVFDEAPFDPDAVTKTWVESVRATLDCSKFFIQTPLATCYDAPAAAFPGYAISASVDSEMDMYTCIGYNNGIMRRLSWGGSNEGVTWTFSGGLSDVTWIGVVEMNGAAGTVYADYGTCTDSLAIQAGGSNYLQNIMIEALWNWNNCGTTADICVSPSQSLQFIVKGDFGGGREMDLTTHSGTNINLPGIMTTVIGQLPGFARVLALETASPPEYRDEVVTASVGSENDSIDVRAYKVSGTMPINLSVSVTDTSLDFSDYMGGNVSMISGSVTLTGITGATFDVTNDLVLTPSDVTYFMPGPGGWTGSGPRVGSSYNGNWFLLPTGGSATGLSLDAKLLWYNTANGWDNMEEDTISNISVSP
ncbi:hypothetical protein ACFL2F_00620 [Myxococcota bacterium]